ncbi:AEC family transporter [Thalassobius vesicularis]|uniref:AEC family transporter n=1 Tax=Thalassobius vesicularis TaxID=1294297 RepID=A0A4S3MA71_9RHOB|nr:AEC family transporter [Thalassobius vesicularis]THD73948.1 AEC family transporter [Thalassobius vesicularis]
MFTVLSITGSIFALIGVGFALARGQIFSAADFATLGRFVVRIALPALILRALLSRPLGEVFDTGYLLAVLFGSLAAFAFQYGWARYIDKESAIASTFRSMGAANGNSGFVGYPVLLLVIPQVAGPALALNMIVENLVMIPLALALAENARGKAAGQTGLVTVIGGRLVRNPIIFALILGAILSALRVPIPSVVSRPIDMLANASSALSLVAIGGMVAAIPLRRIGGAVLSVTLGKLVMHPVLVMLGMVAVRAAGFDVSETMFAAGVLLASVPTMSVYPVLAQQFGEERTASQVMLVVTALSFLTMSGVLALLRL